MTLEHAQTMTDAFRFHPVPWPQGIHGAGCLSRLSPSMEEKAEKAHRRAALQRWGCDAVFKQASTTTSSRVPKLHQSSEDMALESWCLPLPEELLPMDDAPPMVFHTVMKLREVRRGV